MREQQEITPVATTSGFADRFGRFKAKEQRRTQGNFDVLTVKPEKQNDDLDDFFSAGMSSLRILNIATLKPLQETDKTKNSSRKVETVASEVQERKALPKQTSASTSKVFLEHGAEESIPNDKILEKIKAAARSRMKQKLTPVSLPVPLDEIKGSTTHRTTPNPDSSTSPSCRSQPHKSKTKTRRERRSKADRMETRHSMPRKSRSGLSNKIKPATSSEDLYTSNLEELQKAANKYNNSWYTFGRPPPHAQATVEARNVRHESSSRHERTPRKANGEVSAEQEKPLKSSTLLRDARDDEDSINKEEQYATFVDRLRRVSKNYHESVQKYTGTNQVTDDPEKVLPKQHAKSNEYHDKNKIGPSKPSSGRNNSRATRHRKYPKSELVKKSHLETYADMEDDESFSSQLSNDDSFQGEEEALSSFSRGSLDDLSISATSEESVEEGWLSWFGMVDKW